MIRLQQICYILKKVESNFTYLQQPVPVRGPHKLPLYRTATTITITIYNHCYYYHYYLYWGPASDRMAQDGHGSRLEKPWL